MTTIPKYNYVCTYKRHLVLDRIEVAITVAQLRKSESFEVVRVLKCPLQVFCQGGATQNRSRKILPPLPYSSHR